MMRGALAGVVLAGVVLAAALMGPGASGSAAAESGRRHRVVDLGTSRIDVTDEGTGLLVVLLPSTGRGSEDFDAVAGELAGQGFRVLRPQPRGVGASVGPTDGVTFHDFAADVAGVIRQADAGPAIVAGHAYGNWIARTVATDHPSLVRGVVLVAAGAKAFPPELSRRIDVINDLGRPRADRLDALRVAFFAEGHDPTPWLDGWHPDVTRSQRAAGARTNRESWWNGGTAPILDLVALEDPFRPAATIDELRDAFGSRVTVRTIPGASHALPVEKPVDVAREIARWARLP